MVIEPLGCTIRDLYSGFVDNDEDGAWCFHGNLNIRPPYQRNFIYSEDKQQAVIKTVIENKPLSIMYWGTTGVPGEYNLIDGQQRTVSICKFIRGDFSINRRGLDLTFQNLNQDEKNTIMNYNLLVYKCDGTEDEMLDWFSTINIASTELTPQELRNAVFTGTWLADAKKKFSKRGCPAITKAGDLLKGDPNRQEILEEVLKWAVNADDKSKSIEEYMSNHRYLSNANDLWDYFNSVIGWTRSVFGNNTKEMKGIRWGILYNAYHNQHYVDDHNNIKCTIDGKEALYPHNELLAEVARLQDDEEVTSRQGIYAYVLSGDERKLSIRKFPDKIKIKKYKQQGGFCAHCHGKFDIDDLAADHITPWSKGGKTIEGNCQLLCVTCNNRKSNKTEIPS